MQTPPEAAAFAEAMKAYQYNIRWLSETFPAEKLSNWKKGLRVVVVTRVRLFEPIRRMATLSLFCFLICIAKIMKLITTSWDDGHVLDFKLAELLYKYNLPATFYIPQSNSERAVMSSHQIETLAKNFEIGGHTLHHVRLHSARKELLEKEVKGSYNWLCDLLGKEPYSFCFPGGVYDVTTAESVFQYGYKLARTTELFSVQPFVTGQVSATTLQAYPHSAFTYAKHLIKRKRCTTLLTWLKSSETNLVKLAMHYLNRIEKDGGCFHLWGHSWELEEHNLWKGLESLFKAISNRPDFTYVQNKGLINYNAAL